MLREEQIDLRRRRAAEAGFDIVRPPRGVTFGSYAVANPRTGGHYQVTVRGFDVGDNACTCRDFKVNTLGTCKHVEAVLALLRKKKPASTQSRKAKVDRPEVYLDYREPLRIGLRLPPRFSDPLARLAARFFDDKHLWKDDQTFDELFAEVERVPEQVTLLSDAREFMEQAIEKREMQEREKQRLALLNKRELPLDDLLRMSLYPYQMRGVLFAAYRGRIILGDDMGLGKTIQTLAAAELMARERAIERVLVVAPASVKYQWRSEIERFSERAVQIIDGGASARRALYALPTFYRLINYELILKDLDFLNAWKPDLIVLDEAQRIKNWESKISRAVKRLHSPFCIVLTGTPLENKLEELYSIVQFVDDRQLGPAFQFLHDHRVLDDDGKLLGYRYLDRIREKLQPILLRRTRTEVLGQLPQRSDTTVYVEMTEARRIPYAEQQAMLARLVHKKYLTEVDRRRVLCHIANMRMLCDGAFLIDEAATASPKLDELAETLRELVLSEGRKVVVFSQWEKMLRKASEVLQAQQIDHVIFVGSIPARERRLLVERFQNEPACRAFLSTDAGGVGLNLQSADTVINLEPPWNPAVLEQRIARVHRLGQHRPVQVINFVTRDSIEERVLTTIALKKSLFEGVFSGTRDEVSFAALGQRAMLDTVRDLIAGRSQPPAAPVATPHNPLTTMVQAGVQFLDVLASVIAEQERFDLLVAPELRRQIAETVAKLKAACEQKPL